MADEVAKHIDSLQEYSQEFLNEVDRIDGELAQLSQTVSDNHDLTLQSTEVSNNVAAQLQSLRESLIELSAKFDVWQSNVEPMLAHAQTAMQYDNYVLTALAIGIAVAGFHFQKWAANSKQDAIDEAITAIEDTIARGILPKHSKTRTKLIETILNSPQFIDAVKQANDFIEESSEADEGRAEGVGNVTESVDAAALKRAKDVDEGLNNKTDLNKSSTMKKRKSSKKKGVKKDA